jgi:hypothetical protein
MVSKVETQMADNGGRNMPPDQTKEETCHLIKQKKKHAT